MTNLNNINQITNEQLEKHQDVMLKHIEKSIKDIERTHGKDKAEMLSHWEYRREDACKTFVLLYKEKRFYDAMIISGYILELSALIHDVKKDSKKDPFNEHLAMYTITHLREILICCDLLKDYLTPEVQLEYAYFIDVLEKAGVHLIKKNKNLTEVINTLKDKNIKESKKESLLGENFNTPSIHKQISGFIKNIEKKIKKTKDPYLKGNELHFTMGYLKYCTIKHNGLRSFELTDDYFQQTSLFLIYSIMLYETI